MGRRGPLRLGLALAFVLVAQQSLAEDVCRTGCKGASKIFKYAEGTTYKYNYEGKIEISLSSAEGQVTSTEVKALVLLTQQGDCNQVLRLQNVQIIGPNGKKLGSIPDIERPIRLNFHDGHIEDSICIEDGDTQNSLNVKRAVASLFQVRPRDAHETDVFGVCPTETAQHTEGGDVIVQKRRDLNKCAYRENVRQDFFRTTFNLDSEIKASPMLNGDYSAKLRIKNGILDQATANERYLYVPFSVGEHGARAEVNSKLHLVGTSKENPNVKWSKPRTILFENPHPVVAPTSNVNTVVNAVKEVDKTVDIVVGEQTARQFVNLVKTVRVAKKDDLLAAYNQVKSGAGLKNKDVAKRAFFDALMQAGSGDAVETALMLIKSNELNEVEKRFAYIGLSVVKHATEGSLNAATVLLNQPDLPQEAYLGIGNLAGRYCSQHSCENVEAINKLTQRLIQKLGSGKPANKKSETEMVFALKALKNFGHLNDNTLQKIIAVAQNKQAPNRLRVVALETYAAAPCKDKLRNSALHVLQDIQQDSEVRIKAYLALAQCPTAKIGNAVKAMLAKEPSYQVGGFISSHIRGIRNSANPDLQLASQHLGFSLPKKFPVDPRKYSFYNEFSYSVDTLGALASVQQDNIYSQDSWLLRSHRLNLTAEVFGHTFNFMELAVRQENLDKLVEHYFGPKGLLKASSISELLKINGEAASELFMYLERKLSETLRSRRDVSRAEIENIGKAVQIKENELNKDLDVDVSVKLFGSEVLFANLNGNQQELSPLAIIDKIIDGFSKGLDKLKGFKETLRSNMIFLDAELDYPTGLGFPLRLAVEGTSNLQVQAEGQVDVRALFNNRDTTAHVKLIPSASIEVAGRMTLDALVAENGLKVASTLYTATGGDITINLFSGKNDGVDVKFGLPVQDQKIISANHEIVFVNREQNGHESLSPLKFAQAKDFSICLDQLSPFIGVAFCAEVNGPNLAGQKVPLLPFPLAGDAKIGVNIENEDVLEYHLRASQSNFRNGEILIETVGKNKQNKFSVQITGEYSPEHYVKAVFNSPVKSGSVEARVTDSGKEKSLLLKASHDQEEFHLKVGVAISGTSERAVYNPILDYKGPGGEQQLPVNVEGQIILEQKGRSKKYNFNNVRLTLPNTKVISINGNIGNDDRDLFSDLTIAEGQLSGTVKGRLHVDELLLKLNAEVTNTFNPMVNFNLKGEVKRTRDHSQYDSTWQLIHGPDLSSKKNILTITNSVTRRYKNSNDYTVGCKHRLTYPLVGVNAAFEFEQTPKSLDYELDFAYADIKFGSELEVEVNKKADGDFGLQFEIHGLKNKVALRANRQVTGYQSKIDNELSINGMKMEVRGTIKHQLKPNDVDIGADLTVILPTHPTPFKVDSGLKYNPEEVDVHHKVTSGSATVIDAFIKADKDGNANGNVKVNIKDVVIINGQLKAVKGIGNGDILIDVQSLKKQVKLVSNFQVQPPTTYIIELTVYPSYESKKDQKIVLSTNNKISSTNVDSRNSIDVLGRKLEANIKGSKSGDLSSGKVNGEIEVILPTDQYLLGKVSCDHKDSNRILNGHSLVSLEYRQNKNTNGRKVSVSTTYKDTNPDEGVYDTTVNVAADDSNGKNINGDFVFKSGKQGEARVVEGSNKIYGSILPNPLSVLWKAKCHAGVGDYGISSSYGPNAALKIDGKYDLENTDRPLSGEVKLELTTPSKALRTLKAGASGSLSAPKGPSESAQVQGTVNLFADDDGSVPDPIIDFSGEGLVKASEKDGEIKGSINYGKLGPVSAAAGYSVKENGKQKQLNGNVAVQYGQGKNLKVEGSVSRKDENNYNLDATIITPYEGYKKTVLSVDTERSEDRNHVKSKVALNSDGKEWKVDTEISASQIAPLVNIQVKCPKGKRSQLYVKANRASTSQFGGEFKILCEERDFLLEGKLDANVDTIENFNIKGNVNSPALKLNKISFEAHNQPGKTGRKIQVVVKSANQNLMSGSTNYQAREEHGKYIVEGSGSFKIKEETRAANFKYIISNLSSAKNGEEGFEIAFDGAIGNNAIDAELKVTNKQFRILNSYCEKNKECAHFEVDSKESGEDLDSYQHVLEITVDLRKLGIPNQFGLKSVTNLKNRQLDHTVDVHFQSQESSKYQYSVYLHPKQAGVTLTTPKRIVSLEATVDTSEVIEKGGKVSGEVAFYLDKKNQPNKKAAVTGSVDYDVAKKSIKGEAKLSHPGLNRGVSITRYGYYTFSTLIPEPSLSVTFASKLNENKPLIDYDISLEAIADIFADPAQKLVTTYKYEQRVNAKLVSFLENMEIKSAGLGIDSRYAQEGKFNRESLDGFYNAHVTYQVGNSNYNNAISLKGGRNNYELLLKLLNVELLKATGKMNLNKESQTIDSEVSSYNKEVLVSHVEIKKLSTIFATVGFKNTPKDKLQFNAGLVPGQVADLRADHLTSAGKTNLFQASLKLDEANFLKPDYSVNSKEIEKVIAKSRQRLTNYISGIQNINKEWSNDIRKEVTQLGEISRKAAPDLQPLRQYYASEVDKLQKEILDDKSLRETVEVLSKLFGTIARSAGEIFLKLSEIAESLVHSLQTTFAGIVESIDKELMPQLRAVADKISVAVGDVANTAVEILAASLATVSELFEKYQPEIKQILAAVGEIGQDAGRFIQKGYGEIRKIVADVFKRISEEVKALPVFEELKAQYEELLHNGFDNVDGIVGGLREIAATIKDLIPAELPITSEINAIIDTTVDYLEKKIRQQPVDDWAVLERLVTLDINLVKKILSLINVPEEEVRRPDVPSLDLLRKLPKLVAVRFSPISYLLREDPTEEVIGFLLSLINSPRQLLPPFPLFGMVIQGRHIFTYDGKYLTFPGNCKYLLARDAVNGNFTLVGTYANGQLSAITLADKENSITLKNNGQVTLNNVASDLPARTPSLSAYRDYEMIKIKSDAGVKIECTPSLSACGVYVSGFYHSQVKGLLGRGNNEPFDDLTAANGKIAATEAEFANSYKIGNCQPVAIPTTDDASPACNKLFGWDSNMAYCYPFVDNALYKLACARGIAADVPRTEQAVASAYVGACREHGIPISVPSTLVQCLNNEKPASVGDKFSVKVPAKSADIVILVDTIKSNEVLYSDLVKPMIQDLVKTLSTKGISDVEFHLIVYGGENQWPSHVTVGGKISFKGKLPNLKFSEPPKDPHHNYYSLYPREFGDFSETLESLIHDLQLALGQTLEGQTYSEGYQYPFRAQAAKSIIAVTSKPCEVGRLFVLQKLRTLLFKNNQISLQLITPFETLKLKEAKATDVIGFNDRSVFTAAASKKKLEGSSELYKDLDYNDYCVDFTIK
ncbi:unnamed protein product, partial [Phaedon cochleariae]